MCLLRKCNARSESGILERDMNHHTHGQWMRSLGKKVKCISLLGDREADGAPGQQFANTTAYYNHLETFQKILLSGPAPRDADWTVLACALRVKSFKSYPGDFNTQTILRITFLKKGWIWVLVAQSCPTLWDPMNYSLPGSKARKLKWVAISVSKDWTQVSCITGRFFTIEPPGKPKERISHFKMGSIHQNVALNVNSNKALFFLITLLYVKDLLEDVRKIIATIY